jgi:cell division topological specificity factor
MFDNIMNFFKKFIKSQEEPVNSKDTAKERLHLVLMQDRANVSADFLDLMKQEIIEVIKKYIEVDESAIDVRLTNKENEDGTNGAPALYANIPIMNIKEKAKREAEIKKEEKEKAKQEEQKQTTKEEPQEKSNTQNENKQEEKVKQDIKEDKTAENEQKAQESKPEIKEENNNSEANNESK